MQVYLDSSMIVKRYIQEQGTSFVDFLFEEANQGILTDWTLTELMIY